MARANLRGEGMFASGSRTGVFAGVVALDLRGRPYIKGVRENDSFGENRENLEATSKRVVFSGTSGVRCHRLLRRLVFRFGASVICPA